MRCYAVCPVLNLKFAIASFPALSLCIAQILWISLPFLCCGQLAGFLFVLHSYFVITRIFFIVSACNGVSLAYFPFWLVYLLSHCLLVQHGREPTGIRLFLESLEVFEITDTGFITSYKCEMACVLLQVCWPTLHQCRRRSRRFQSVDFVQSIGSSYADR